MLSGREYFRRFYDAQDYSMFGGPTPYHIALRGGRPKSGIEPAEVNRRVAEASREAMIEGIREGYLAPSISIIPRGSFSETGVVGVLGSRTAGELDTSLLQKENQKLHSIVAEDIRKVFKKQYGITEEFEKQQTALLKDPVEVYAKTKDPVLSGLAAALQDSPDVHGYTKFITRPETLVAENKNAYVKYLEARKAATKSIDPKTGLSSILGQNTTYYLGDDITALNRSAIEKIPGSGKDWELAVARAGIDRRNDLQTPEERAELGLRNFLGPPEFRRRELKVQEILKDTEGMLVPSKPEITKSYYSPYSAESIAAMVSRPFQALPSKPVKVEAQALALVAPPANSLGSFQRPEKLKDMSIGQIMDLSFKGASDPNFDESVPKYIEYLQDKGDITKQDRKTLAKMKTAYETEIAGIISDIEKYVTYSSDDTISEDLRAESARKSGIAKKQLEDIRHEVTKITNIIDSFRKYKK